MKRELHRQPRWICSFFLVTFIRHTADIDPLGGDNGCIAAGGCVQYEGAEGAGVRRRVCFGLRLGSDRVACAGQVSSAVTEVLVVARA